MNQQLVDKLSGKYFMAGNKDEDRITANINGITFSAMYKVGNLNAEQLDMEWLSREEFISLLECGQSEDEIRDMIVTKIRSRINA
jgi:hypothetical protein